MTLPNGLLANAPRCGWCGVPTTSVIRVCASCRGVETGLDREPVYEDALTGGRWVAHKGIQRWVPWDEDAA